MFIFLVPVDFDGPRDRWEWLMEHLSDRDMDVLLKVAYDIVKNYHDAQDVVQSALLIGMKRCHQIKDEQKVFSWMYSIVRREAYAYLKRYNRDHRGLIERLISIQPPVETSAEYEMMREFDIKITLQALEKLKSPGKEIVRMHKMEQKSMYEVAKVLDMNYNTVRSTYRRAMQELAKIRKRLEDEQ